ncbi:hypothetical protein NP233_g4665 [Leucocoprinus birnbaumii]|uniref:Uncharacterized protein n=1 Tax=Leucocoprinus birnbaumii TaxID=56174 RepID=A0AAD5VUB2_9AGAR|nr:hypothetical protein NP233_g4665 [Leucocoprinus birnbaumii]
MSQPLLANETSDPQHLLTDPGADKHGCLKSAVVGIGKCTAVVWQIIQDFVTQPLLCWISTALWILMTGPMPFTEEKLRTLLKRISSVSATALGTACISCWTWLIIKIFGYQLFSSSLDFTSITTALLICGTVAFLMAYITSEAALKHSRLIPLMSVEDDIMLTFDVRSTPTGRSTSTRVRQAFAGAGPLFFYIIGLSCTSSGTLGKPAAYIYYAFLTSNNQALETAGGTTRKFTLLIVVFVLFVSGFYSYNSINSRRIDDSSESA